MPSLDSAAMQARTDRIIGRWPRSCFDFDPEQITLLRSETCPTRSGPSSPSRESKSLKPPTKPFYDSLANNAARPLPGIITPRLATSASPDLTSDPDGDKLGESGGLPVDSSDPEGGCGSSYPALLPTLPTVECEVRARIPTTTGGEMWLHVYQNNMDKKEHCALVFGPHIRSKTLDAARAGETETDRFIRGAYTGRLYHGRTSSGFCENGTSSAGPGTNEDHSPPLVRVHSECYTGETVWSARCECGEQLDEAARLMSGNRAGGIIIYLRQEGRGIGLAEKLKAYNLQDLGHDTVEANLLLRHPADARCYGLATAMLMDLGQKNIRLLTNNPDKIRAVEGPNREVVVTARVPMVPLAWKCEDGGTKAPEVIKYLKTKIEKMGHMLPAELLPKIG